MLSETTALLVTAAVGAAAGAFLSPAQKADATDATTYGTDATDTWNFLAIGDWGNDSPGKCRSTGVNSTQAAPRGIFVVLSSLMLIHSPY